MDVTIERRLVSACVAVLPVAVSAQTSDGREFLQMCFGILRAKRGLVVEVPLGDSPEQKHVCSNQAFRQVELGSVMIRKMAMTRQESH